MRKAVILLAAIVVTACAGANVDDVSDDEIRKSVCANDADCSKQKVKAGEGAVCDGELKRCVALPIDRILCGGGSVAPWHLHDCPEGASCPEPSAHAVGQRLYCLSGRIVDAGRTVDPPQLRDAGPKGTSCKADGDCPKSGDPEKATICDPATWACASVSPASIACRGGSLAPWYLHACPDGYECPPAIADKIGLIQRCRAID